MKLKLRFDKDDMKKFLIVCAFLLYVVAVAISNLSSVTSTGEFTGLNPFPAFSLNLIGSTILFYLIAIIALMVSTKSYFFEFEKGFGFTTDKKNDGYSKWCDAKDIKKELKMVKPTDAKADYAGIALINDGKKIWVDDGDYHNLIIGSTGSGKTQNIIFPMIELLAKHGESMIITDPKGELYEKKSNMLRSKGYNIVLLNFRDPGRGNAWNPMSLPYNLYKSGNRDKAMELLDDLALNILYDEGNKNADPFWEKTSADYFSGLSLGLFEDAKEEEINLNSISLMTTVGEEKLGGSTYIKEYFNLKDPGSSAYINASSTILAPADTKMSILAVFKQKIKLFASRENLSEMLSYSDFDIADIGKRKTAVFIIVQDEKKTYHSLVTIFIKQVYETLIDVAQNSPKNRLPIRTNFLLDEFANMPPLKDVTTMITAARSRAMRFTMIIQNFAQLNEVYGEQNAETIKGNCGNTIYLISTELKALKEISEMCGEIKVKTGKDEKEKEETRPLITISDLQKMKMNEVIIRRIRLAPFKTKLTPEYQMQWEHKYREASVNNIKARERKQVQMFDVREFVKEKKKNAPNPFASANPFGGGMSPFGGMGSSGGIGGFSSPSFPPLFDSKPLESSNNKIDVDKILANLDAKIAEIEAEEKRLAEEEKMESENKTVPEAQIENDSLDNANNNIQNIQSNSTNIFNNPIYNKSDIESNLEYSSNEKENIDNILNDNKVNIRENYKPDNFINNNRNDISNYPLNENQNFVNNMQQQYNQQMNNFSSAINNYKNRNVSDKSSEQIITKPIKDVINNIDSNFNPIVKNDNYTKEEDLKNVDLLVDKIRDASNINEEHIKPNMEIRQENKYTEVSDDEFFDDFFD